jgi:hypothetical protein
MGRLINKSVNKRIKGKEDAMIFTWEINKRIREEANERKS